MMLFKTYVIYTCDTCKGRFQAVDKDRCYLCGRPDQRLKCAECLLRNRTVPHVALYKYNQAMKDYIRAYKLSGGYHLFKVFSAELKQQIKRLDNPVVVPIPVTEQAFNLRGFNQVEGLLTDTKYNNLLVCQNIDKPSQKSLNIRQRLSTQQPFQVNLNVKLPDLNQQICVVDDIFTTGQTINHAVTCLQQQGFTNIMTLSLAR